MSQKNIKVILNLLSLKRTTFLVLLFFIISSLIIPSHFVSAGIWDILSDPAAAITEFASNSIIAITSVFLTASQGILQWVISTDFISVKFTQNPIVDIGWTTVRDFANMFFILILVAIALGTALRIREYEVKKLLPALILIAVLINFTPVICGFIIDAANIIMNTFLKPGFYSEGFVQTARSEMELLAGMQDKTDILATAVLIAFFNLIGAFVFLLFALLFFIRYIALWILVILSPIAFLCYVLPQTRGVWSKWWNQFIQWSIIGIPAAFFLYLANIIIREISAGGGLVVNPPSGTVAQDIGVGTTLVMFLVPLIFMIVGFFVSLQSGALGASGITSAFSGLAKKTRGAASGVLMKAKEGIKQTAPVKGTKEKLGERAKWLGVHAHPTERGRLASQAKYIEANKQKAEEQQKLYSSMSTDAIIKHAKTDSEKAAMIMELKKRKKLHKLEEAKDKKGNDIKTPEKLYKDMKIGYKYAGAEVLKDIDDQRVDLAGDIEEITTGKTLSPEKKAEKVREEVQKKQPVKFRQEVSPEALKNEYVIAALDMKKIREIEQKGSDAQKKQIQKTFDEKAVELQQIHSGLASNSPGEADELEDVRNLVKNSQVFQKYK